MEDEPLWRETGWVLLLMATLLAAACSNARDKPKAREAPVSWAPDLLRDFQQVLPRGRIAAIDDPHFVSAAEAKVSPEAWILGFVVDGQARAYSLNLLNRHEVVNDQTVDKTFAVVW